MKKSKKSSTDKILKKQYVEHIEIFTDGSCMNKSSGPLCGYGVYFSNVNEEDISKKFTHTPLTNQRAELYAIYRGIGTIIKKYSFNKFTIYTDSTYSIGCLTLWINNWKRNDWKTANKKSVKNKDIIQKIDKYISREKYTNKIKFVHVKAHTGKQDFKSLGNAKADTLATNGALGI